MTSSPRATEARERAPLTREGIIRAAVALADDIGVDALSMRRLGAELGVEAMSIYGHIADKAAVLDGIAEFVLREIYLNGLQADPVGRHWEDCIRDMARAFRRTAVAHPGSFPLVMSRHVGSGVGLQTMRAVLAVFTRAGLTPADSVHVMRAFVALLTGSLMRELGVTPTFSGRSLDGLDARVASLRATGVTELSDAAEQIAMFDHQAEYDFGVELLLSAIRLRCPASSAAGTRG